MSETKAYHYCEWCGVVYYITPSSAWRRCSTFDGESHCRGALVPVPPTPTDPTP